LFCGCAIEPFETPSAYDKHDYLCGTSEGLDRLEEAADDCRQDPEPCRGYISFQGQVQRVQQLRVDTTLERSIVRVAVQESEDSGEPPAQNLSRVELSGAAPYFHFDVAVSSIGTPWSEGSTHWMLDVVAPDPKTALNFGDGDGAVQWYIRAGSDTALFPSVADGKGAIGVTFLSNERVDLRFSSNIGPAGDRLDACAIAFPEGGVDFVSIPAIE
jgi:hypothetical protein